MAIAVPVRIVTKHTPREDSIFALKLRTLGDIFCGLRHCVRSVDDFLPALFPTEEEEEDEPPQQPVRGRGCLGGRDGLVGVDADLSGWGVLMCVVWDG